MATTPRIPALRRALLGFGTMACLFGCADAAPERSGPVPAQIAEQLGRYAQVFSFSDALDPDAGDRILGRLCADSFRMSYATPGEGATQPALLDMSYQLVLSLIHMMHEAARGDEPALNDIVPSELAAAWVPFAELKPKLRVVEVLRHYPVGEAVYVTVVHDAHEGLPEATAPGGAHHYETHLTWVQSSDGWRLYNKVWVDVPAH
jgi:hypothetical protein